ncbi:MAG: malto-oligosyltrehalose synthase [Candidatus Cyclobacteriaceae bacterium M2_1C_046]
MKFNPNTTYRIQFHKGFNFKAFEKILPYLNKLGVRTLYASPIFEATPGSTHGYDVTNPQKINPEIGSLEELKELRQKLDKYGIKWIQDIVPNHMAFDPNNKWLMDVLEKGPKSKYVNFFDISWSSELYKGRVMVPFLGAPFNTIADNKEVQITEDNGNFFFKYYDNLYPLNEKTSNSIKKEDLNKINNSPEELKEIHDQQYYNLCHWQETNTKINFRRFFTINGLISLNMQDQQVFDEYHKLVKELLQEGIFDGLRIDHVDGMYDPKSYLTQLRALAGDETYIIIEKILEAEEQLPDDWPIEGNTGYDFLAFVNNVFTNKKSEETFTDYFHQLTGDSRSVEERIREKKKNILNNRLAGDLDNLHQLLLDSDLINMPKIEKKDLKAVISEFLIECPVYRFYGNKIPLGIQEQVELEQIFTRIRDKNPQLEEPANLLEKALLHDHLKKDNEFKQRAIHFYQRLMQYTGPVMAKGVEDTLMYTYSRFIGHNDVGDNPSSMGIPIEEFQEKMIERHETWPLTMNTTSTHDTKRGEDVRMRLNIITDLKDKWVEKVEEWRKMNEDLKENNTPDNNDEYFLYQTILGAYPMPGQNEDNFPQRFKDYITKALREAKRHSNWTEPDEKYEKGTKKFAAALLDKESQFWKSFKDFHKEVSHYGVINSLSQVILKYTCPGVPDLYQGCELYDLSLVDPDNRRPVDYDLRDKFLKEISSYISSYDKAFVDTLWQEKFNGQIKLWLTHLLLDLRKHHPKLFEKGDYIPLQVKGKHKQHVMAFARKKGETTVTVIIPLNIASLAQEQNATVEDIEWGNTRVEFQEDKPHKWHNMLTKVDTRLEGDAYIQDLFKPLPLCILKSEPALKEERSAGILMHITSLPSSFGAGDMGPEAYKFADFLERCNQRYWQILPLNPTEGGAGHSPYSSHASMAGNILLISPEMLIKDNLLDEQDLKSYEIPSTDTADFGHTEKVKRELLEKSYNNRHRSSLDEEYIQFLQEESHWVHDYGLYMTLKAKHNYAAWFQWPEEYKNRNEDTLNEFREQNKEAIDKIRWYQFIFIRQWKKLKTYCNEKDIMLFGDLPFYISHDSVDVWSHPDIFKIDEDGKMTGVAGVPPDYFNENGQLWGMPVFRWNILKKQKYNWWVKRIQKNVQLYDLLRLDHFRAFSDFWEVPAGEDTAINGTWRPGPGADLFKRLRKELGELPFIAEDLGEIDDPVYELRDSFEFPGMKVVQFAFGGDIKESPHIPHNYTTNYIAYTGTHDNNTSVGWFRKDAGETEVRNLKGYFGKDIEASQVHKELIRAVYSSVAQVAIIPMQDILGLDENSRMNMPATIEKNWVWRLKPDQLNPSTEEWLREFVELYNRG